MKKSKFAVFALTILAVFFFAQTGAMALMEETEVVAGEQITSLNQVELFDMQGQVMVNLGDLLEGKVTLLALVSPDCPGCRELNSSLTVLQRVLESNEKMSEKFQILGVVMVPFIREKINDEGTKFLRASLRAHYDIFVDVDTKITGKNIRFLAQRFFVLSYPTFVLIEPNGPGYNTHIVRSMTSYDQVARLLFSFEAVWSKFMKSLNEQNR